MRRPNTASVRDRKKYMELNSNGYKLSPSRVRFISILNNNYFSLPDHPPYIRGIIVNEGRSMEF